jgi:hypothetical protein
MDPALLEEWMMTGLLSILIIFMGFIVWDLAKKSKAGRFGSFILFFVLGLGVAAFVIKSVVIGTAWLIGLRYSMGNSGAL